MDFKLSKDQLMIQQAFKEFSEQVIAPVAERIDETNVIPDEVLEGLGEMGVFGMAFPEKYGGNEAGYTSTGFSPGADCPPLSFHRQSDRGPYRLGRDHQALWQ